VAVGEERLRVLLPGGPRRQQQLAQAPGGLGAEEGDQVVAFDPGRAEGVRREGEPDLGEVDRRRPHPARHAHHALLLAVREQEDDAPLGRLLDELAREREPDSDSASVVIDI